MLITDNVLDPYSIKITKNGFRVIKLVSRKRKGRDTLIQEFQSGHARIGAAMEKIIQNKMSESEDTVSLVEYAERLETISFNIRKLLEPFQL